MKSASRLLFLTAFLFLFQSDLYAKKHPLPGKWVNSYWFNPLPPQGEKPEGFSELEASLMPENCGQCHEKEYKEWKTSRHSMAMGAGVMGQFHNVWLDAESQIACQNCHAPLYEQRPFLPAGGEIIKNRFFQKVLQSKGVDCASCHLRRRVVYGPPPRNLPDPDAPHNGFAVKKDFNRSGFCKPCHQFDSGGRQLKGKFLEDTYRQWERSPAGKRGESCASCHMPDREHSFQGIHSEKMAVKGISIRLDKEADSAILFITNSGVGHKYPTYITPRVSISGRVVTPDGKVIGETVKEYAIQWKVSLDIKREYFDTRLDPGETLKISFAFPAEYTGNIYEIEVRVYPDDFYSRFFAAILENPPKGLDLGKIRMALDRTLKSDFSIFNRRIFF